MLRERLIDLLTKAAEKAQKEGKLPSVVLPEITIERPQNAEHGDYASNFPLKLARIARANPMVIANELVDFTARHRGNRERGRRAAWIY